MYRARVQYSHLTWGTALAVAIVAGRDLEAQAGTRSPVGQVEQSEQGRQIDQIVAPFLAKPGAVGLTVGVATPELAATGVTELGRGYGKADLEFGVDADADTLFRIGSITKQFTAAAVMRLVESGALSLDDTLAQHVSTFDTGGVPITLTQLLDHTSGIPSFTSTGEKWRRVWPLELSHAEVLGLVAGEPLEFEPGTQWRYNNTAYYLVGMILEKVHGKPYATCLAETVYPRAGLTRTRYDSNRDVITNRAQGYNFVDGTLVNDPHLGMSQPGAAGALLSNGAELVRWSQALADGRVVSAESFARMTDPTELPDGGETRYGLGLFVDEFEGRSRIQHGGGIHGFNSMLMWFPAEGLHIAVVSNSDAVSASSVATALARALRPPR